MSTTNKNIWYYAEKPKKTKLFKSTTQTGRGWLEEGGLESRGVTKAESLAKGFNIVVSR